MGWVRATAADFRPEDDKPLTGEHKFVLLAGKWPLYCERCGHVALKNEISRLITAIGCGYERDPRVIRWRQSLRKAA